MSRARILYDFQAEGANELSGFSGEEFQVINANMFDGWIQVKNNKGEEGIVPSSYIEYITDTTSNNNNNNNDSDEDIPPPPSYINAPDPSSFQSSAATFQPSLASSAVAAPQQTSFNNTNTTSFNSTTTTNHSLANDPWANQTAHGGNNNKSKSAGGGGIRNPHSNSDDYDSDDFDEEDTRSNSSRNINQYNNSNMNNNNINRAMSTTSATNAVAHGAGGPTSSKTPNTKKAFDLDVYLLHGAVKPVPDSDRFSTIVLNDQRQSMWKRQSPPYTVQIVGDHVDKKYHGVKKFTSYEIKASIFSQRVRRRYNHFDWLHKRLSEKYGYSVCVPGLPDKQVTGNFEGEFIAKRKAQLELWLNKMSAHPVIGQSEVFVHFLQCDESSAKWKSGKRKAEKDEYRGAQWFATLTVPGESVDTTTNIKERIDKFSRASRNLDYQAKSMMGALEKLGSFHTYSYKKELTDFGKRLEEFGSTMSNDALDAPQNATLSAALYTAGTTYAQIGHLYGEQSKLDINPLLHGLSLYRSLAQEMPDVCEFEKNSIKFYEELQQRPEKLEGRSLMEVAPRREVISHVTFAEMNQFNKDKVEDINSYMKTFLKEQIAFYSEITECLKRAYVKFEEIPTSGGGPASTSASSTRSSEGAGSTPSWPSFGGK